MKKDGSSGGSSGGSKDGSIDADGDGLSVGDSVAVMEGDGVMDADRLSLGVSVGDVEREPVRVAVRVVLGVIEELALVDALVVSEGDALALAVAVADVLAVAVGVGEGYTAHSVAKVVASLHTLTCKRPDALAQEARRAVVEALHGYGQVATQCEPAAPVTVSSTTCHQTSLWLVPAPARACRVSQTGTSGDK